MTGQSDSAIVSAVRKKMTESDETSLRDEELLSLILRNGDELKNVSDQAHNLIRRYGSLTAVSSIPMAQLTRENKGMTQTKAAALKAAFELGKRAMRPEKFDVQVKSPQDVMRILGPEMATYACEHFCAVLLNTKNRIIAVEDISVGTINASLVHARELFRSAIQKNAYSLILVHNHPSGDPTPSTNDMDITAKMDQAGRILGINVTDHIIIAADRYYSFLDAGKL